MGHGLVSEDAYNLYDKPMFADRGTGQHRAKAAANDEEGDGEQRTAATFIRLSHLLTLNGEKLSSCNLVALPPTKYKARARGQGFLAFSPETKIIAKPMLAPASQGGALLVGRSFESIFLPFFAADGEGARRCLQCDQPGFNDHRPVLLLASCSRRRERAALPPRPGLPGRRLQHLGAGGSRRAAGAVRARRARGRPLRLGPVPHRREPSAVSKLMISRRTLQEN